MRAADPGGIDKAVAWFPLVGALIGLFVAGAYVVVYPWMPSLLGAVVAIVVGVWLTGAFHEDGLADTFDALGSGAIGDDALRIMRDARLGTYGTTAVVLSVLWRVVAVGSLTPTVAIAGLVTAHSLARTGAVVLMVTTPPARSDGLGLSGASAVTRRRVWVAIGAGLGISLLAVGWWIGPAVIFVGLTVIVLRRTVLVRIGGTTGDVLGACEQLSEILVVTVVAVAAWQGSSPWWAG